MVFATLFLLSFRESEPHMPPARLPPLRGASLPGVLDNLGYPLVPGSSGGPCTQLGLAATLTVAPSGTKRSDRVKVISCSNSPRTVDRQQCKPAAAKASLEVTLTHLQHRQHVPRT